MPVFICLNKDCIKFNFHDTEVKVKYIEENGALIADKRFCPSCGEERSEVVENPEFIINVRNSTKRKWSKSHKNTLY